MHEQIEQRSDGGGYRLEEQVGFALRKASQRHIAIFTANMPDLTPTQFAALAKTYELGSVSQNELGRSTAMDAATVKGVVDRLHRRGLVRTDSSRTDRRRLLITLTDAGAQVVERVVPLALQITDDTLAPLTRDERRTFLRLLCKLS